MKALGLTEELLDELLFLRQAGVHGTLGGAVKCVDIKRNAGGEDGALGLIWRSDTKAWGANGIRYPGSPRRKRCLLGCGSSDAITAEAKVLSRPPG